MEIITAILPSISEAKKRNGQKASEFISFPCSISCADQPSRASASWCPCGVGSLPLLWVSLRLSAGPGVRKNGRTLWGEGGEIDYQLEPAISICPSPHLIQRPSESNGHYFTSTFQISRMFLLWLTLNGIIQGKQCWETAPTLTNLTEQSHLCGQEATLRK